MSKKNQGMLFISAVFLPIIPLLYLYNQNSEYLSAPQVLAWGFVLIILTAVCWVLTQIIYKSEFTSFLSCLVFVILLFAFDSFYDIAYNMKEFTNTIAYEAILFVPALTYILTYIIYKLLRRVKISELPKIIAVIISVMLLLNLYPFIKTNAQAHSIQLSTQYKNDFFVDESTPTPNVYWVLCDGLLGFDAMETYFEDSQSTLISALTDRGFQINKTAMLESGHKTRIAVPALMCPDYYDAQLKNILADHEKATNSLSYSAVDLYNARFYNETIGAFEARDYTTISMALDEEVFFPTTDFFYYIASHMTSKKECAAFPYYVEKADASNSAYYRSRYFAYELSSMFLGGIPLRVFDHLNSNATPKYPLTTAFDKTSDVLLASTTAAEYYTPLVNSLYDSIYAQKSSEPKFVLVHDFMPHGPFCFDSNGGLTENQNSIMSYPGHHTYVTKVLINFVDMILDADPNAVIVLQADHGLHMQSEEQIMQTFDDPNAVIDIWNNIFSAIRVPDKFENSELDDAVSNPLNISRFLVNSYVGKNYSYVD